MDYRSAQQQSEAIRKQINALRTELASVQAAVEPEPVTDYELATISGRAKLSSFFGDQDSLFVIHNMGKSCNYCTLWADTINGFVEHLKNRAGVVLTSPDDPETQASLAASRGWRLPLACHAGTTLAEDLGYQRDGGWWPGVSVLKKTTDGLVRVADTAFGSGDDFCGLWHLLALLPEGANGWQPQPQY